MSEDGTATPFDLVGRVAALSLADSGYIILTVALTEQSLEKLLLTHMELSDRVAEKIFGDGGTLGSFAAKINVACALKLIESKIFEDLRAIRKVRNAFAHPRELVNFSSPAITNHFKGRKGWCPGRDARTFFNELVTRSVKAMDAKIDSLIYAQARSYLILQDCNKNPGSGSV